MSKYKDTSLPIAERVDDLISQMTLEEKISQMVHTAPAIERLGIPEYNWWNEALHGVGRAGVATVFPQAIGLAATWNQALIHQIAVAISDEARAKHHEALRRGVHAIYTGLTYWSPNVNIFRDPRWGRGQETFGEDPYLTASLGVAFVRGLQGDDERYLKLVATPKHFAVHSGPESQRHSFDAQVSERELRETYLPQFEACVKEGRAYSIMGAYNRVNGEACCASGTLLQKILREEWGFEGYVVSDCWAIIDIYAHHKIVSTAEEAAALAVKHGCDLNCGCTFPRLEAAVEQGLITEEVIDQSVKRLFTARFKLGMFDPPEEVPYAQIPYEVVNSEAHQALALTAARESIVLLKNEAKLLPLSKEIGSIAVIGPNANQVELLLGNYHGTPVNAVTPLAGIRKKLSPSTRLYYAPGSPIADGVLPLEVIPSHYLYPADSAAQEQGLDAAYFDNAQLAGEPVAQRIDSFVDMNWKGVSPLSGQWGDGFSVRWSGYLCPPASGRCRIGVNGFNAYKLYLDDEPLVEFEGEHDHHLTTKDVELEAGRFYQLRLEYCSYGVDSRAQLLWAWPGRDYQGEALAIAEKADVIVAVMGLSPLLEREELTVDVEGFLDGDRTDIGLPAPQEALLKQLHALGKPVVLVLLNGSSLAASWAAEQLPAIVEAWYPGEAGGEAIADVLFGDYNPAGRLPVTFYQSVADLPPFEEYQMDGRTYRFFQGEPLFPFGYGLTYTTFQFDNLQIERATVEAGGQVDIHVDVTNTGERAGDEVVQLYIRQDSASARLVKELKGFKRVSLEPGECKTVVFTLSVNQLASYDEELLAVVRPGRVEVMVGNSSSNLPLRGAFEIVGSTTGVANEKVFFSQVQVW